MLVFAGFVLNDLGGGLGSFFLVFLFFFCFFVPLLITLPKGFSLPLCFVFLRYRCPVL